MELDPILIDPYAQATFPEILKECPKELSLRSDLIIYCSLQPAVFAPEQQAIHNPAYHNT